MNYVPVAGASSNVFADSEEYVDVDELEDDYDQMVMPLCDFTGSTYTPNEDVTKAPNSERKDGDDDNSSLDKENVQNSGNQESSAKNGEESVSTARPEEATAVPNQGTSDPAVGSS